MLFEETIISVINNDGNAVINKKCLVFIKDKGFQ